MQASSAIVAIKLEQNIKKRYQKLADLKDRSPHWLMKQAILTYLAQEEAAEQLKQETLARWEEAERGEIVSHTAVSAWLDTWGTENETNRPPCGS